MIDTRLASLAAAACLAAGGAAGAAVCSADLDGDGAVTTADLLDLLSQWGTDPGGPPDFDGDGTVATSDLLFLLADWGPVVFQYPPPADAEAEQIGFELLGPAGPLLVPPDILSRIEDDLAAIRTAEPALGPETHSPAWIADQLIVKVLDGLPVDDYECLNAFYQVIDEEFLFDSGGGSWWVLTFAGRLNAAALPPIYMALDEIEFAEPNGLFGGQNFWVPTPMKDGVWHWSIDDGFHDCFDGCDCHRFYELETDARGNVKLISYQEVGPGYCDFGG